MIFAAGLLTAGCSGSSALLDKDTYSEAFAKKIDLFAAPDWSTRGRAGDNIQLSPKGPVRAEDLVSADGACAPAAAPVQASAATDAQPAASPAAPPADRPVGSVAGDLAGAPMATGQAPAVVASAGAPPPSDRLEPDAGGAGGASPVPGGVMLGGVALGMSECDVVRRAGQPTNVAMGGGGERRVTLTYLGGNWPGIYHFQAGRLKEIDAAPTPPKPEKPVKGHKKTKAKPKAKKNPPPQKSVRHDSERVYVQ